MGNQLGKMERICQGETEYLRFPEFEKYPFVRQAFSTRRGGVSGGPFSSMNLAFGRGDPDENVLENYHRLCAAAGIPFSSLVSAVQVHSDRVLRVGAADRGTGIFRPPFPESADALVTNTPGVTLVIHTADCVPIFLLDPEHRAVGLAHAGWRGTALRIGKAAVMTMEREFGSRPEKLLAGIGPSIGPCCFEVDPPVRDVFASMKEIGPEGFIRGGVGEKSYIDLWEANRRILESAGVPEKSITEAGICTKCHADRFFSHRAAGEKRGGLSAFLGIAGEENP